MKKKFVILAALSATYIIASSVAYAATDDRDKAMRAEIFEYRDGEVVCEGYICILQNKKGQSCNVEFPTFATR
jgi:hypothetical protein